MFAQAQDLRPLDARWQNFPQFAKETTFNLDDWDEFQIQRWDLDDPVRTPTGRENPRTWEYEKPLIGSNQTRRQERLRDARQDVDTDTGYQLGGPR